MSGSSLAALRTFFESAPVARRAARPLTREARVNLTLDGGDACFTMESGAPEVRDGAAADPDFTLVVPPGAIERITSVRSEDVGEFGIAFFQLVRERDPGLRIRVHLDAPTARLVGHGYLGVLALGGVRIGWWLVRNGIRNPRAAIDRLRGVRPR